MSASIHLQNLQKKICQCIDNDSILSSSEIIREVDDLTNESTGKWRLKIVREPLSIGLPANQCFIQASNIAIAELYQLAGEMGEVESLGESFTCDGIASTFLITPN